MKKIALFSTIFFLALNSQAFAGTYADVQQERQYAEPSDDSAIVYIVRPALMGMAIKMWSFVDDQPIGVNKGKQYTFAEVEPGKHLFWSKAENVSSIELEVEAGKTYYIKQKVKYGINKARVKLIRIDEAEGQKGIKKCRYTQFTPEGEERAKEIAANKQDVAKRKVKS